jgi:hypothetical protein
MELKTYKIVRTAIVKELHKETFLIKAVSEERAKELATERSILDTDIVSDVETIGEFLCYSEDECGSDVEIISIEEHND